MLRKQNITKIDPKKGGNVAFSRVLPHLKCEGNWNDRITNEHFVLSVKTAICFIGFILQYIIAYVVFPCAAIWFECPVTRCISVSGRHERRESDQERRRGEAGQGECPVHWHPIITIMWFLTSTMHHAVTSVCVSGIFASVPHFTSRKAAQLAVC